MFDIRWIRDNPDAFDAGLRKRGLERVASPRPGEVMFADQLIVLDEARRRIVTRLQEAQARRNAASKEIGKAKGAKDEAKAAALMAEVAALKDELAKGEEEQKKYDQALHDACPFPQLPRTTCRLADEKANKEVRRVGRSPSSRPTALSTTRSASVGLMEARRAEAVRRAVGCDGRARASERRAPFCSICHGAGAGRVGGTRRCRYGARNYVWHGAAPSSERLVLHAIYDEMVPRCDEI